MIKENLYEHPKTTFKQTLEYIRLDGEARLKFMNKSRTWGNIIMNYLSPSLGTAILYRLSHYFFCKRIGLLSKFFYSLNLFLYSCEITPISVIGPGLHIPHTIAVGIHGKIGKNALLFGQVVIGGSGEGRSDVGWVGGPVIGDNLVAGVGTKILATCKVGNNVFIGAMSLVTKDVPDNAFMFGIPAKVVKIRTKIRHRYAQENDA